MKGDPEWLGGGSSLPSGPSAPASTPGGWSPGHTGFLSLGIRGALHCAKRQSVHPVPGHVSWVLGILLRPAAPFLIQVGSRPHCPCSHMWLGFLLGQSKELCPPILLPPFEQMCGVLAKSETFGPRHYSQCFFVLWINPLVLAAYISSSIVTPGTLINNPQSLSLTSSLELIGPWWGQNSRSSAVDGLYSNS